jgi:hypothetical protein
VGRGYQGTTWYFVAGRSPLPIPPVRKKRLPFLGSDFQFVGEVRDSSQVALDCCQRPICKGGFSSMLGLANTNVANSGRNPVATLNPSRTYKKISSCSSMKLWTKPRKTWRPRRLRGYEGTYESYEDATFVALVPSYTSESSLPATAQWVLAPVAQVLLHLSALSTSPICLRVGQDGATILKAYARRCTAIISSRLIGGPGPNRWFAPYDFH